MYKIIVPLVPPSPNVLRRKWRHPMAYRRLRTQWECEIWVCAELEARNVLRSHYANKRPMYVRLIVHHYATSERDPDNLSGSQKVVLDALRNVKFLYDDSRDFLEVGKPEEVISTSKKDLQYTIIEIGVMHGSKAA